MRTVLSPPSVDASRLEAFVDYLHGAREQERTAVARELHDGVGSLLVAAAMELGWVESRATAPELQGRLRQLGGHLAEAIKINRQSIERLRPTLLDTFGLFECLRWSFKNACHDHPARCSVTLPDQEIELASHRATHVFRATETLLACTLQEDDLETMALEAFVIADTLAIRLGHHHVHGEPAHVLERFRLELASASYRIAAVGGELTFDATEEGALYSVHLPLHDRRPDVTVPRP